MKRVPIAETAQDQPMPDELPQEPCLRAALEQLRLLAAQSRLLALNAAFESAGAAADSFAILEPDVFAADADWAVAQADRVSSAVEKFLQQIRSASVATRHCVYGEPLERP